MAMSWSWSSRPPLATFLGGRNVLFLLLLPPKIPSIIVKVKRVAKTRRDRDGDATFQDRHSFHSKKNSTMEKMDIVLPDRAEQKRLVKELEETTYEEYKLHGAIHCLIDSHWITKWRKFVTYGPLDQVADAGAPPPPVPALALLCRSF